MNTTDIQDKTEDLKNQAHDWKETAQQWHAAAMDRARNAAHATHEYVHENVWSTIALSVLAGCALGFLIGRSRD